MKIYGSMDGESLKKLTEALGAYPKECANGIVSAINKSVHSVNVAMKREISKKYNLAQKDLSGGGAFKSTASNNLIRENKASYANLNASITVRGGMLNPGERFLNTPKQPKSHKGKTMRQIRKIKYPKVMIFRGAKKTMPAFTARGRGGTMGVFTRDGEKLKMQKTLSVAQMASNEDVWKKTSETAQKVLTEKAEQELNYRLGKVGGQK
ncbi:hypothetical protein OBV_25130 [Oscillibacter valericigenes Sjm18-20]|nr:hypothetical protein OBV_25130 [Oscillibacter valericigenes Sjm18-20]